MTKHKPYNFASSNLEFIIRLIWVNKNCNDSSSSPGNQRTCRRPDAVAHTGRHCTIGSYVQNDQELLGPARRGRLHSRGWHHSMRPSRWSRSVSLFWLGLSGRWRAPCGRRIGWPFWWLVTMMVVTCHYPAATQFWWTETLVVINRWQDGHNVSSRK